MKQSLVTNKNRKIWLISFALLVLLICGLSFKFVPQYNRSRRVISQKEAESTYASILAAFGQSYNRASVKLTTPYWKFRDTNGENYEDYTGISKFFSPANNQWVIFNGQIKGSYDSVDVSAQALQTAQTSLQKLGLKMPGKGNLALGYTSYLKNAVAHHEPKPYPLYDEFRSNQYLLSVSITPTQDDSTATVSLYLSYGCKQDFSCNTTH